MLDMSSAERVDATRSGDNYRRACTRGLATKYYPLGFLVSTRPELPNPHGNSFFTSLQSNLYTHSIHQTDGEGSWLKLLAQASSGLTKQSIRLTHPSLTLSEIKRLPQVGAQDKSARDNNIRNERRGCREYYLE